MEGVLYTGSMALGLTTLLLAALAGDPAFEEGIRLYRSLEYEQAIFRFQEVAVRADLPADDKAAALIWLGLSYAGTGDLESARRMFGDALRADRATSLPPDVSPRVVAVFDEVKASLPGQLDGPAPPPPPPPAGGTERDLAVPLAATGIGVAALVGGGALAVAAAGAWSAANDKNAFQDEVKASLDAMNLEVAGAAILLPTGAVLAGLGAVLLMGNGEPTDATAGE